VRYVVISDIEQKYLDNPLTCPICYKKMKPQFDKKLGRVSGFIWRCDCMPKGQVLMLA